MSSQLQVSGEAKIRDIQGPVVANSGVITALDGAANQYVRGDGTLASFPTSGGGGSSVSYYLNGSVNQGTFGGSTYYQMSKNAIVGTGTNFSTSANGLIAQFITDANDPDVVSIPSGNWNIEFFMSVSASSGALASFYVEIYKYNGSTFTLLATNVATPEQLTNTTTVDAYFTSVAMPLSAMAVTDRLAVRIFANVASKTVTLYTEDNRLCQIVTTFSKGMLSLNNLTDQSQYLATGTSGTDFNIVSSGDTHTFNIPIASATNTGKLSSTDWSTFNAKQPAGNYVTLDTTQTITAEKTFSLDITVNSVKVGEGGGSISGNTILGTGCLNANTTGQQNTAIGYATLNLNTTGNDNTGIGYAALNLNTTGSSNTALGSRSLFTNTTGASNTAIGSSALIVNTTGTLNTAIGHLSLQTNTTGYGNTSVGYSALGYNTTGFFNAAIGINALLSNTTGTYNNALGTASLYNNTTGSNNTAVGQQAGTNNTTGSNNTYIGFGSGGGITTGSNNTIIGQFTGTAAMVNNIVLADGAGNVRYRYDGTNNNLYGNVNFSSTIGNGTFTYTLPSATGTLALTSNLSAYLPLTGGTLTGALSGTSATFSGNFGVGTASPSVYTNLNTITINGTNGSVIDFKTGEVLYGELYSLANELRVDAVGASGVLKLMTNSVPRLTIASTGAATFSSSVTANGIHSSNGVDYDNGNFTGFYIGGSNTSNARTASIIKNTSGDYDLIIRSQNATSVTTGSLIFQNGSTEQMRITSGGNVGIGTSSPGVNLEVASASTGFCAFFRNNATNANGLAIFNTAGESRLYATYAGTAIDSNLTFWTTQSNGNQAERMRITSNGSVCINASSPGTLSPFLYNFNSDGSRINAAFEVSVATPGFTSIQFRNPNGAVGSININTSSVSYNTTSDYRLKEDLKDFSGLDKVSAIKVYDYKWKSCDERMDGVLAHELAKVLPYAVNGEKDGELMQGVDYSKIVPILIKSIQELQAKIVTLESKLN